MATSPHPPCPCASGLTYKKCCRLLHHGRPATTPEALMRSRFSAYALGLSEYILATTDPDGPMWQHDRDAWLASIEAFSANTGLSSLNVLGARVDGEQGTVLFQCLLTQGNGAQLFSEESAFVRHEGLWKYHSGKVT